MYDFPKNRFTTFARDAELGWGRLSRDGSWIHFFDSPTRPELAHPAEGRQWFVEPLTAQQRVWWFDGTRWLVGRIFAPADASRSAYVVEFPNHTNIAVPSDELRVRWNRPLKHPLDLLVAGTVETRFFHAHRTAFLSQVTWQRTASMSLGGLLSSAVELHDHQLGAARRILADPIPRYILADEVGLGKTVEAGMVLRQLLLHGTEGDHEALVLVPDSLEEQWRVELKSKFRAHRLPAKVRVMPHSRIAEVPIIERSLTIVDEAHRLTYGVLKERDDERRLDYEILVRVAKASRALLLLSATPVRSNEDGFLGLLHLLDPVTYKLEDIEGFRRRVEMRDVLAETMSAVDPEESPRYLREPLMELRELLAGDETVAAYVARSLKAIAGEDRSELRRSVASLRFHVSEAYRIHRRMIRNRRPQAIKAGYPARGREHSPQWRLLDTDARRRLVFEALEDFRLELEADCTNEEEQLAAANALQCVLGRALAPAEALRDIAIVARGLTGHDLSTAELDAMLPVLQSAAGQRLATSVERILELSTTDTIVDLTADWAVLRIGSNKKFAIACSFPRTAAILSESLAKRFGAHRISSLLEGQTYDDRASLIRGFARSGEKNLLVMDRSAEEGTNLQFIHEVLHVNLPTSISQIEQRLGRFDRWDEYGVPILSTVVTGSDDLIGQHLGAWLQLVDEAFAVFTESTATLQYILADLERDFFRSALTDSFAEASNSISDRAKNLEKQRKRIIGQEALDSIEDRSHDRKLGDLLGNVDKQSAKFQAAVHGYIVTMLGFTEVSEEPGTMKFGISRRHPPLLPEEEAVQMRDKLFDLPYVADRIEAAEASSPRGLLRWGEPLIDTFAQYAEVDDRGRAFAVELVRQHPRPESDPLILLCFDFVVSARQSFNLSPHLTRAATTRITSLLPTTIERIWWMPGYGECPASMIANVERTRRDGMPEGVNLGSRPERFRELTGGLDWQETCERSLAEALAAVRNRDNVVQRSAVAADAACTNAEREHAIRVARNERQGDGAEEQELSAAVMAAVRNPEIELDSCGTVIITWVPKV
ncbi:protein DpdE [Actinoplanes palleronii]|uniref:Uncharacterized protein n=1 Tax=Actinoplanes palleronii TaxID=113570 RepID=A0ABQ4B1L0_9ACTN|nr:hypothetical protein Apa02nite_006580 [Actinoplanes palleronii]